MKIKILLSPEFAKTRFIGILVKINNTTLHLVSRNKAY